MAFEKIKTFIQIFASIVQKFWHKMQAESATEDKKQYNDGSGSDDNNNNAEVMGM